MILPDKYVRKEIYDRIHNIQVNSLTIPAYDMRTATYTGKYYTILSTQTNTPAPTKCSYAWDSSIEIQVVCRYQRNAGSRVIADDVSQAILTEIADIGALGASGLRVAGYDVFFPGEFVTETDSEIVVQKIIRIELRIN